MDMRTNDGRLVINAPRLGQLVELVEPRVGEVMAMNTARNEKPEAEQAPIVFEVLALCLRIDGEQFTAEELLNFGARKMKPLMALTGQAMHFAGFLDEEVEEDGGPKD